MDEDLKKNVEKLERGVELADQEAMHGEMLGQAITFSEDVEEKNRTIKKLKGQLRLARGISIASLFVLIVVLLYACAGAVTKKPTTEQPASSRGLFSRSIEQSIINQELTYSLAIPPVDISQVESTTLEELASTLSDPADHIRYCGVIYQADDAIPSGVSVYSEPGLWELMRSLNRVFVQGDVKQKSGEIKNDWYVGCSIHYFNSSGSTAIPISSRNYFSGESLVYSDLADPGLANNFGENVSEITIQLFGEDADIESLVLNTLQSFTYGDNNYLRDAVEILAEKLEGKEFSLEFGGKRFSSYDSVEEQDGHLVCTRGTKSVIPKEVFQYDVQIRDCMFHAAVCAAQEGWY